MKAYNLMLLHGAGGTPSKWRRLTPKLEPFHVRAADLSQGTSIQEKSAALTFDDKTVLIGHSMGSLCALEATSIRHPAAVIIVAGHPELPVHEHVLKKLKAGTYPAGLFHASYAKHVDEELLEEEKVDTYGGSPKQAYIDFKACTDYSSGWSRLEQLKVPVLFIYGSEDRLLPEHAEEKVLGVKPDADVKVIEGSGHYVMLEKPDETAEAILSWLQERKELI
ncbi:alpha/beta fold hydrolase [Alkalicoccus luteus]|uniref:Alpha/beta hydrolase n=1 Tax=Alkalicoccus luteus TaxID=1237094 RepID=A0A969TWJ7_9BACI|nr:alpha/beta hydrolase [Alkalicoccus luteus]NJP39126.1 alpha/beta hydrolase [Alkalicoccus luteus]